jgi:hypothetical protein
MFASRSLREDVAILKLLLARVGDYLEPTEAFTSCCLGLGSEKALFPFNSTEQKSYVVEEERLYGCFSPYGSPSLLL